MQRGFYGFVLQVNHDITISDMKTSLLRRMQFLIAKKKTVMN